MNSSERYKIIQINISRSKHPDLIKWLENKADEEETSLNSIILRALKKEYLRDAKSTNNSGL